MNPDYEPALREALCRTFFEKRPPGFPASKEDEKDLLDHLSGRYQDCRELVIPWVEEKVDLEGAEILEIGCGTGSSTASFAERAGFVHGYDIADHSVRAANERLHIMGISNALCQAHRSEDLLEQIEKNHPEGVDLVLLYAVMEHQSVDERIATLETCWRMLRPGGHLVVTDTPNRLCYKHYHTSEISFFDMLPQRLAFSQIEHSPRAGFRNGMAKAIEHSAEHANEVLTRWGTGVSYHEFELVVGPLRDLLVGDGFDPVMASRKPLMIEEELLLSYLAYSEPAVPPGFSRVSIDIILRKPDGRPVEPFRSRAEKYFPQIRERYAIPLARSEAVAGEQTGEHHGDLHVELGTLGEATHLEFDWARRVAEDSLNGRTLFRIALAKFVRKISMFAKFRRNI